MAFRVLVTKYSAPYTMLGEGNPYIGPGPGPGLARPWIAICQDRFPPMRLQDDGFLPPIYGKTRDEAMNGMHLTIKERLEAQQLTEWSFVSFGEFGFGPKGSKS